MSPHIRSCGLVFLIFSSIHAADLPDKAGAKNIAKATCVVDAVTDGAAIPLSVYGKNNSYYPGSTVNRHGGNRHTGFNWENNASNAGSDYRHQSDTFLGGEAGVGDSTEAGAALAAYVEKDRKEKRQTIISLPLAGYVAADTKGPVGEEEAAPGVRWKETVINKSGKLSLEPDPSDDFVYLDEMVNFLVHKFGTAAKGGVAVYSLDNEPALWAGTHPRIHPKPAEYKEVAEKGAAAAEMVTKLDPTAQVYGPVVYGWGAYTNLQSAPDRDEYNPTYGDFAGYYLAQMKKASDAAGRRLLTRFDVHWYSEAKGDHRITMDEISPVQGTERDIDVRLQAPRSLWDDDYVEPSWVTSSMGGKPIRLLGRLQESIDKYYPGTGMAITEYNYGGTSHISGGVAQADALGIFTSYQVAGCFWPLNDDTSYIAAAFKLYRDYDNAGGAFGDVFLTASASDNSKIGIHAARTKPGSKIMTIVAINRSQFEPLNADIQFKLKMGQSLGRVKAYRLDEKGGAKIVPVNKAFKIGSTSFPDELPAMSATLYEVQLK